MPYSIPRCQVVPLPQDQVAFLIEGTERLRWHHGPGYPRPFFYPLLGPGGSSLTRMGHPGAPNHDHHRSIWFAHAKVLGIDFWSDRTAARIRQKTWLAFEDGPAEARMAVLLGWYDGHDPKDLLEQELVAAVRPGPEGETFLEFQANFRPLADSLEFGQTNFGFLAVRVAKSISAHFGGGRITSSEGKRGEPEIFGTRARWMDYSGPVPSARRQPGEAGNPGDLGGPPAPFAGVTVAGGHIEGITFFDHPANPGHPSHWHVREDGWMGASVCMHGPVVTRRSQPLVLRYLLHAHRGDIDADRAARLADEFAKTPPFVVRRSTAKHQQYAIPREADA